MTDLDDIYYIRQVQRGDADAFVYIVRRYERMVFSIVGKIVSSRVEVEDIVQEVFIKVFLSLDKFRQESGFGTWLYRIAYNTTISELRKRRYQFTSIEDSYVELQNEELADDIDELATEEKLHYLETVLKKMSPDDALLITMFYLNNHSIQEISEIADLSVANVKVKLHRIRKYMNFEMNKLMQE